MPYGEGWWLNLNTGEAIPIHEHASEVVTNPKKYGLKPSDFKDMSPWNQADRVKIVKKAMANGFARVREAKSHIVFEFDYSNFDEAVVRIVDFLKKAGFGEYATIEVHDIRNPKKNFEATVGELLDPEKVDSLIGAGVAESVKVKEALRQLFEALKGCDHV